MSKELHLPFKLPRLRVLQRTYNEIKNRLLLHCLNEVMKIVEHIIHQKRTHYVKSIKIRTQKNTFHNYKKQCNGTLLTKSTQLQFSEL